MNRKPSGMFSEALLSSTAMGGMGVHITYIAGTISNLEKSSFERICYRASRGKVLCYFSDKIFTIKDFDGVEKTRVVYVLVFQ